MKFHEVISTIAPMTDDRIAKIDIKNSTGHDTLSRRAKKLEFIKRERARDRSKRQRNAERKGDPGRQTDR